MRWIILLFLAATLAPTQSQAEGERAGDFDYYVLALSWSPSFCALEGAARGNPQCDRSLGWVMHGLWPQYDMASSSEAVGQRNGGWPSYCPTVHRNPSRADTAAMADIMGSGGSAWHQWNKHGRCTGLSSDDYYALSRLAFDRVNRPEVLRRLDRSVTLPAAVIEEAFLEANSGWTSDMLTITCKGGRIAEARLCLTRDLTPRPCAADVRRDCRATDALLDPINE
ncbi:MAG: ribonuclease T2 [Myxococcota bacterium]